MKAAFYTLGCKVNQYESQAMEELFRRRGYEIVPPAQEADLYIVNSCTVTSSGDKKTRQIVRRLRREHPLAVVALTGCLPQTDPHAAEELPEADLVLGTRERRAVVDAVDVPVTVKTRIGWDRGSINVVELAKILEDSGAAAIAVHGRTRSMLYSGVADWDTIRAVKEAVSIPVVANGDIFDGAAAVRCRKRTGADLFMVGRAAFGDPWIFQRTEAALNGLEEPARPPLKERVELAVRQFDLARADKGEHIACLEARKHFAWYLKGVAHSGYYKAQISEISTMEDIARIAAGIIGDLR